MIRKFFAFFLFFCLTLSFTWGQGDTLRIEFPTETTSLDNALLTLRRDYGIDMAYDSRALRKFEVRGEEGGISLERLLKKWLEPIGYRFSLINGTYVIVPKIEEIEPSAALPAAYGLRLHGRVLDRASGEPLPYAHVSIRGSKLQSLTNDRAWFTLGPVPADTCVLLISYVGYSTQAFELADIDWTAESHVFEMEQIRAVLPTAVVSAERKKQLIRQSHPALYTVSPELFQSIPNLGEPDPVRALQLLPGISGTLENSADLHIRGGAADENLVVFDGFTLYYLDHFYGLYSAFNSNSIQNIRLHSGVFGARFGGRTAGVLEITGKQGNKNNTVVKADLSPLSASLHLETPIIGKKATLTLSGRRSFTDVLVSPVYRNVFNNLYANAQSSPDEQMPFEGGEPDFRFYDLSGKIAWESEENDLFSLTFYSGNDRLAMQLKESSLDDRIFLEYNDFSTWGNTGVGMSWARNWSEASNGKLTLGYSTFNSKLLGFDVRENRFLGVRDTLFFDRSTDISDLSIKYHHEYRVQAHNLSAGMESTALRTENARLQSDADREDRLAAETLIAFYAEDRWSLHQDVQFTGGLRMSFYSGDQKLYLEPRMRIAWHAGERISIHAAAGRNHQFIRNVRRQDLFFNTSDEWRLAGESGVPVLRADQLSLGFKAEGEVLHWSAEGYLRQSQGAVQDVLRFLSIEPGTFDDDLVAGTGRAGGLEAMVSKPKGVHSGWVAYTFSKAMNQFEALSDQAIPANFDRRHELKALYRISPGRIAFNAVMVYGSGLPFTAANGVVELSLPNGETRSIVAFSELNAARLPDYHRLDVSLDYSFRMGKANARAGLSVYNVYQQVNIRNRYYFSAGSQADRLLLGINDLRFLGRVPSIQFSVEW